MCAGHEVCTEQRETDGVSALGGKLQALLEHFFKSSAVETAHIKTQKEMVTGKNWKWECMKFESLCVSPENGQV